MASDNKGSHPKGSANNKPAQRSSKKPRKPVTIDLEAAKVVSNPGKHSATGGPRKSTAVPASKPSTKPGTVAVASSTKAHSSNPKTVSPTSGEAKADTTKPAEKIVPGTTSKVQSSVTSKVDVNTKPKSNLGTKTSPVGNGQGGGGIGYVIAGILGGVIALAGAFLLQQLGIISPDNKANSELAAKISRIDIDLNGFGEKLEGIVQSDVKSLVARTTKLETQQKASTTELDRQNKALIKTSEKLLAESALLLTNVDGIQQSIASGATGASAAIYVLEQRVRIVEASAANAKRPPSRQLEALRAQIGDNSQATILAEETAAKIADLSAEISKIAKSADDGQTDTNEKISEAGNTLDALQESLAGFGTRLEKVEELASTPQKNEQRVASVLAVTGLKSAIDGGGEFESALSLVKSLGGDTQITDPLKPFAATGVPTITSLKNTFAGLSDKIVRASSPVKDKGSVDQFFSNFRSLVTVKSTGAVEGNNPQAIMSRIEQGLKNADLDAVLTEWGTLPEAAKTISSEWSEKVKARRLANSLIKNLLKKFMTGASGAGN